MGAKHAPDKGREEKLGEVGGGAEDIQELHEVYSAVLWSGAHDAGSYRPQPERC